METIVDRFHAARTAIAALLEGTDVATDVLRILDRALEPAATYEGHMYAGTDWGVVAQRAAEEHLLACYAAMHSLDEGVEVEDPAVGPFCGCETCEVREVLHAAWPILRVAALDGAAE